MDDQYNEDELRVRFQGREFLLIGSIEAGGAIATREQFDSFQESYAHLFSDGEILRFGQKIGTIEDLEFLDAPAPQASNA